MIISNVFNELSPMVSGVIFVYCILSSFVLSFYMNYRLWYMEMPLLLTILVFKLSMNEPFCSSIM